VFTRRTCYYNVLKSILDEHGVGWDQLSVVGDIFEFDGLLPWMLGAQVFIMLGASTPEYERAWFKTQDRIHAVVNLTQVLHQL